MRVIKGIGSIATVILLYFIVVPHTQAAFFDLTDGANSVFVDAATHDLTAEFTWGTQGGTGTSWGTADITKKFTLGPWQINFKFIDTSGGAGVSGKLIDTSYHRFGAPGHTGEGENVPSSFEYKDAALQSNAVGAEPFGPIKTFFLHDNHRDEFSLTTTVVKQLEVEGGVISQTGELKVDFTAKHVELDAGACIPSGGSEILCEAHTPVPAPSAIWLFSSGLFLLVSASRKPRSA